MPELAPLTASAADPPARWEDGDDSHRSGWRARLLALLRVPPYPAPPSGDVVVRVFRAASGYYHYKLLAWVGTSIAALFGLYGGLTAAAAFTSGMDNQLIVRLVGLIELVAAVGVIGQIGLSIAVLRLDFELRWYILGQRSLRIREGIIALREQTMTYANIQEITIRQNPLQRLFGISDVTVRTAGGGGGGGPGGINKKGKSEHADLHTGFFRGVADAEAIRDEIRERVRAFRDAGLGDPDDRSDDTEVDEASPSPRLRTVAAPTTRAASAEHQAASVAAARELLAEIQALRRTATPTA